VERIKRIVVKVGSQLLAGGDSIDAGFIENLAGQVAVLRASGVEVVVVSSGAVLAGIGALELGRKPFSLQEKQALSAVGQPYLMSEYRSAFEKFGMKVAQVLLTAEDLRSKERFVNARNTFDALLRLGVVPVVNENDTVSVEEIKIGDNDNLSAHVAVLISADMLIMLTLTGGLYDRDPMKDPGARLVPVVESVQEAERLCRLEGRTPHGTGGMWTKLQAAEKASRKGIPVVIAGGRQEKVLERILSGERVGTLFLPVKKLKAKKYRILYLMKPAGRVYVDEGAETAIVEGRKSLLSKGIKRVEGGFRRGDAVDVYTLDGRLIARGIARCSFNEVWKLPGVFIHRDELVLFGGD
jgi:glutamate 5-kinase